MTNTTRQDTVLVTGGSGFIGAHTILQLLAQGYPVRTSLRSLKREAEVRAMIEAGGGNTQGLSFVEADLNSDAGWAEAVKGCTYVLHIASPFPPSQPKDEEELIRPAREGSLRVLRAARDAGVKRVVLTSSLAAVAYGHTDTSKPFTEESWTNLNASVTPYVKSKTLAERAAWDFIAKEGGSLELSVINPVGVAGPVLGSDFSSSIQLLQSLLKGSVPRTPRVYYSLVDVRDVADLHIRAMTHPAAKGERFLATVGDALSVLDVAKILRKNLGDAASKVPSAEMPDWLVRVFGLMSPAVRSTVPNLGIIRRTTNEKAVRLLGWSPRTNEEAITATGESLLKLGLV
ncbi:MAG: aldehyde reductase [Anaerolineales bacterium]